LCCNIATTSAFIALPKKVNIGAFANLGFGLASQSPPPPWVPWQFTQNERIQRINGPVDVSVLSGK